MRALYAVEDVANRVWLVWGLPFTNNPAVKRQKDIDSRWTQKHGKRYFGYKDHISIDKQHKVIRDYEVTTASVHDSQVVDEMLCDNTSASVYADSAYRSEAIENLLCRSGYRSHIHRKGRKNKPLSKQSQQANRRKSSIRVRVEHVFGAIQNNLGGKFVRTIRLARASVKIGLKNLTYNLTRLVSLHRISASA